MRDELGPPRVESPQTPALEHLLRAYFHQDWDLDGTEAEVIDRFLTDEPDLGAVLPDEVADVLAHHPDDELERVLWDKGSYYKPRPGSGGHRGFLERVAQRAGSRA